MRMPCLCLFFSYSDFFILLPFTCIFIFSSIRALITSILIYLSSFLRSSFLMPLSSSCFLFGLYTSSFFSSFSFVFFSFFLRCLIRVLSSLFYHCSSLTLPLSIRPLFKRCLGRCSAAIRLLPPLAAIVRPLFGHYPAITRLLSDHRRLSDRCSSVVQPHSIVVRPPLGRYPPLAAAIQPLFGHYLTFT